MRGFGIIHKQAQQFIELRDEMIVLIQLSNAPRMEVLKKAGISDGHFYRLMSGKKQIQPKHIVALTRAIIEVQNYRSTRIKVEDEREL